MIVRYGELALKKKNRAYFEKCLIDNLTAKLHRLGACRLRKLSGRVLVEFVNPTPWQDIKECIRNVFGFSSASPVERTPPTMAELEKALVRWARSMYFSSFAVRTKRSDKGFPLTSPEICARIGALIKDAAGAKVDLSTPEIVFNIEVLPKDFFFSCEVLRGPGGLPVGSSGKVLSLLSGGIDSPVASWMMMKRGLAVDFVHFHSAPFTGEASIEKVFDIAEKLSNWQNRARVTLVPFGGIQKEIITAVPAKYRVVLYRRFMMRIASRMASLQGAEALVTGEALGQVASQTLSNLAAVEAASHLPVFRPLIGLDKQEIINMAEQIGTYAISTLPHQDCCTYLQPPNPATKTTADELDEVESELPVGQMVESALAGAEEEMLG